MILENLFEIYHNNELRTLFLEEGISVTYGGKHCEGRGQTLLRL